MNSKKQVEEYEIPQVEMITVEVEKGFSGSNMENLEEGEETKW